MMMKYRITNDIVSYELWTQKEMKLMVYWGSMDTRDRYKKISVVNKAINIWGILFAQ